MTISVRDLSVMQDGYRLPANRMQSLLGHVRSGGMFDCESLRRHGGPDVRLAAIVRFENGLLAIRDGLHRLTAILLARASGVIDSEEYLVEERTFEMFRRSNLAAGFYTPFDPLMEVRAADLGPFWLAIKHQLAAGQVAEEYINAHRHLYVCKRQTWHESLPAFYRHSGALYDGCLTANERNSR